tara:strand:- start:2337 stop:4148 length:1812 start_codon:yes stop_codon:yes gene_type:complete
MIERKVRNLGAEVSRASIFLSRNLASSITVERSLEKKSLDLKKKIVEQRGRTLRAIGSRDKDSGISGGIGGALGLLGIGATRRLFKPRVPKTPGALLRLQRGAKVSRVGQLGRLARPLAIVGTGLDFIGRRAEGQTNVQAGVGAAGGLAGSLAGAKYGAILGTAVGGPIGTVIGGTGGAIIGGLAGGRIADLFTGANRRRQFEEERTLARTQRSLFADALDDFDNVLDKLEDLSPALVLKRDDDELPPVDSRPRVPIVPPKPKPFLERPAVRAVGITLAIAGAIALAVFSRGRTAKGSEKVILELIKKKPASFKKLPLKEQLQVLFKDAKRQDQLTRMNNSPFLTKRGTIVPGQKGAPAISKQGKIVRNLTKAERAELKANKANIELQKKIRKLQEGTISDAELAKLENDPMAGEIINEITRATGKGVTLDPTKMSREALTKVEAAVAFLKRMDPTSKNIGSFNRMLGIERSRLVDKIRTLRQLNEISPKESTKIRLEDAKKALKIIDDALKKFAPREIQKKLFNNKRTFENLDLSSNDLGGDGTNIALGDLSPTNNIFLINQREGDNINVTQDNAPPSMGTVNFDSYSAMTQMAMFDASLTA